MRCDLLDYELPDDRIARRPTEARDGARLLVVDPGLPGGISHAHIRDLPELLPRGALIVVNDTRVIPARLLGKKTGTGLTLPDVRRLLPVILGPEPPQQPVRQAIRLSEWRQRRNRIASSSHAKTRRQRLRDTG